MKKLVISGSSKLYERALYWRGYFEGRGYEVIDWPRPLFENEDFSSETPPAPGLPLGRLISAGDPGYAERNTKFYQQFYKHLDQADTHFIMNEDKDGFAGYIGPGTIAELTYSIILNLNRGHKTDIQLLQMPSKDQKCYEEVKFWLDQKWINIYRRPTGKKATIPIPDTTETIEPDAITETEAADEETEHTQPSTTVVSEAEVVENATPTRSGLFHRSDKMLDITTCKKRCLHTLTPEVREYLKVLSPEFPAWLLKYIAAPEMQRLAGVSTTCGLVHTSLYNYKHHISTLAHSIGVALIVWHFTQDKKQTLAGLFHDIASPAFKHSIDFMNGDSETQESTEERTAEIIRESRAIMKQLKKDGILASEVSDYHLYPIADNESPNLAADRLEYTLMNGYFHYDIWTLDQVKTFYHDLTITKNENDADEIAFRAADLAAAFTTENLPLAAIYHGEKSRANMQFLADIIHSMISSGYLTEDDLYVMSEREIIDWILSCGDKTLAEAFRNYQRATTVFTSGIAKKNCYCISTKAKVRYIVPLVASADDAKPSKRITKLNKEVDAAVTEYIETKQPKYVGFDFDFEPYTE